jgi:hypothetical protein
MSHCASLEGAQIQSNSRLLRLTPTPKDPTLNSDWGKVLGELLKYQGFELKQVHSIFILFSINGVIIIDP